MLRQACLSWLALGALLAPAPVLAAANCQLIKFADIPVTMTGPRPIVTAGINGRDALFLLNSGAFYSTIAQANAQEYGLSVHSLGQDASLSGVGGESSMGVATAKTFTLNGQDIHNVEFAVGGRDTGYAGVLGQNILGLEDVEYDLPHSAVRLMKVQGCRDKTLAYWAGSKPFSVVKLIPEASDKRTIGVVTINGVELKALFDTASGGSALTMSGARRLGLAPNSPKLIANGFGHGVGPNEVRSWRVQLDTIDIGGELIKHPSMSVLDQSFDDVELMIGIDFFLSHRLFVDNDNHRMFLTYEGGAIFGSDPGRAVTDTGEVIDLTDKASEPTDAAGYSQRGAVALSKGRNEAAVADFDKAVSLAPTDARYLLQRAKAGLVMRQAQPALADLDKAVTLAPSDPDARMTRAEVRIAQGLPHEAIEDLDAIDKALAPSSDARMRLARLNVVVDRLDVAIANYDLWLKAHPEDPRRGEALNGRCWIRGLQDKGLAIALADCDAAVRARPGEASYLDSRALVRLRLGDLQKAQADYDAALTADPRSAWSLYMRSILDRRMGKAENAAADRAQALSINPRVGERAKHYGLED